MDNVIELPKRKEKIPDLLFGPCEPQYLVMQDNRIVPRLTGKKHEDGSVSLFVDRRFGATFADEETARQAAWLIAQASAIAAGYPHFEADSKDRPFASKCFTIGTVETEQ